MKSKIMKRQNVRTLSLIVCTFTYLFVGAAVFDALESGNEVKKREELHNKEMTIRAKYNMSDVDFEKLRRNIERSVPYHAGTQWKFSGAFYFSLIVVAAIGYGHSTPQTSGGKIFCMFYALCGIPLCLVMFQSVGERLNVFITFTLRSFRKCFKLNSQEVSETHVILVTMILSIIVLIVGAVMFNYYENWYYIDSLYYCFITLTTIGFGDYVALQKNNALQSNPEYVVFSLIFILFGLTVISAAMNLLVLRFLTMNTEDERRDELEAAVAAQNAIHLDGDVIMSNGNVHVVSNVQERKAAAEFSEVISVCSCSCYKWHSNREQITSQNECRNQMFTRSGRSKIGDEDINDEADSFLRYHSKRNSF